MNDYSQINHSQLLDMLASDTTQYTQMLADNNKSEDFYKCKRRVEKLTAELESRRHTGRSQETNSINSGNAPLIEE